MDNLPGNTWEYWNNTLTVQRIKVFRKYWEQHPPIQRMVANFLGIKPKKYGDLSELLSIFPNGKITVPGANPGG